MVRPKKKYPPLTCDENLAKKTVYYWDPEANDWAATIFKDYRTLETENGAVVRCGSHYYKQLRVCELCATKAGRLW